MFRLFSALIILSVFFCMAHAESSNEAENIKAKLVEAFPTHTPDSVSKAPMNGFYEAVYGTQVIYISDDGRYVMQGVLMDLEDNKRDLTEVAANKARQQYLVEVNKQESISFGAEKPQHTITVFTDIDCGYCRKLHAEMDQYASYGIKVNYLLFPRNGITSPGYTKAVSVWCSNNREDALTKAKSGESLEPKNCDNPVVEHFEIGKKIGVTGTPALLTSDGQLMPGYVPAKDLAQRLDQMAKK